MRGAGMGATWGGGGCPWEAGTSSVPCGWNRAGLTLERWPEGLRLCAACAVSEAWGEACTLWRVGQLADPSKGPWRPTPRSSSQDAGCTQSWPPWPSLLHRWGRAGGAPFAVTGGRRRGGACVGPQGASSLVPGGGSTWWSGSALEASVVGEAPSLLQEFQEVQ